MSVAVFNTEQIFNNVKAQGALPSGLLLGLPIIDVKGRCACWHEFVQIDVTYLNSFDGVNVNGLPVDWEMPPDEE